MQKKTSFEKLTFGVAVMGFAVVLTKICGLFFKIPLTRILGTSGMGIFNTAYTVYTVLFVLCTAGLPSAMSVNVSVSAEGKGRYPDAHRILVTAIKFFAALGLTGSIAMYAAAAPVSEFLGNPESASSLKALSACVFFTCLAGVFRGFFQGHGNMVPTAVSQVIEALGKLVFGVLLAFYALSKGLAIEHVSAYAVFGVTVASVLSCAYLALKYVIFKAQNRSIPRENTKYSEKNVLKSLFRVAAPITLSSLVMSLVGVIDLLLVMHLLKSPNGSTDFANDQYGAYSALATPLFNLPSVMVLPIATAALPVLAGSFAANKRKKISDTASYAVKVTAAISVPCALGLLFLSAPILSLIFDGVSAAKAAPMLSSLATAVIFMCLTSVQAPILQGAGRPALPMISMAVGAGFKIAVGAILIPKIGIYGCAMGTFICYCISSMLNGYFIEKKLGLDVEYMKCHLHAAVCAIPATALAHILYTRLLPDFGNWVACVSCVALCVLIYCVAALLSGYFKIKDIACILHVKRRI